MAKHDRHFYSTPPPYHKEASNDPADWIFLQVFTRETLYLLLLLGTKGTEAVNLDITYSSQYDIILSYVKTRGPWFPVKFEILLETFSLKRRVGYSYYGKRRFLSLEEKSFMFLQTFM